MRASCVGANLADKLGMYFLSFAHGSRLSVTINGRLEITQYCNTRTCF